MAFDPTGLLSAAESALDAGNGFDADRLVRKAFQKAPDDTRVLRLLGIVCAQTNRAEEAIDHFRQLLHREPDSEPALAWLAMLVRQSGNLDEATELSRRLVTAHPDSVDGLSNLGLCLLASRRLAEALDSFRRALELAPDLAALHHNQGQTLELLGRDEEAALAFRQAIRLAPETIASDLALGQLVMSHGDNAEAIACCERALEVRPDSVAAMLLLARALTEARQRERAEEVLRRAVRIDPDAKVTYGYWLQEAGRFDESAAMLAEAIHRRPIQGLAYHGLVQTRKIRESDRPLVETMESFVDAPGMKRLERAYLHYALGKSYDNLGEFGRAIHHYDRANALADESHFGGRTFDRRQYASDIDQRIANYSHDIVAKAHAGSSESDKPILIVGMMRSGTTLVEQILASHPDVAGGGELRFWLEEAPTAPPSDDGLRRLARQYDALLSALAPGTRKVTDKMPHNYLWLGLVHMVYPNARFVHLRRNPVDNCLSIYATSYRTPPRFAYRRENIVFAYREYRRLMNHWRAILPSDRFIDVDYEELIVDRETVTRRLVEFCGLPWDDACLHHERRSEAVNTPSLWQVRQPIYNTSVERWRRYEPWLSEFRELLGES